MGIAPHMQDQDDGVQEDEAQQAQAGLNDVDGLKNKKPEDLTPDELRLMADTMPGEGPGD